MQLVNQKINKYGLAGVCFFKKRLEPYIQWKVSNYYMYIVTVIIGCEINVCDRRGTYNKASVSDILLVKT